MYGEYAYWFQGVKGVMIEKGEKSYRIFAMPTQAFAVFNFESNSVKAIVAPSYDTLKYYIFFMCSFSRYFAKVCSSDF